MVTGEPVNATLLSRPAPGSPALRHLEGDLPYSMQPVIWDALARVPSLDDTPLREVYRRLAPNVESTDWAERN